MKRPKKISNPYETSLFLSSFLSRLVVRKNLREPAFPSLSLARAGWYAVRSVRSAASPISTVKTPRKISPLLIKCPQDPWGKEMVCYLWRCSYSVYVAEEEERETAVGHSEDVAMVCGHLIAPMGRSSNGLSFCCLVVAFVLGFVVLFCCFFF